MSAAAEADKVARDCARIEVDRDFNAAFGSAIDQDPRDLTAAILALAITQRSCCAEICGALERLEGHLASIADTLLRGSNR